jgi:hypothetical protein
MKTLIRTKTDIPWLLKPGEGRLYITDETPPREQCGTAFGFVFEGENVLLAHILPRGWDIPVGVIDHGETPKEAAGAGEEVEIFLLNPLIFISRIPIGKQVVGDDGLHEARRVVKADMRAIRTVVFIVFDSPVPGFYSTRFDVIAFHKNALTFDSFFYHFGFLSSVK